jgi:S1-C subfamily serine protease
MAALWSPDVCRVGGPKMRGPLLWAMAVVLVIAGFGMGLSWPRAEVIVRPPPPSAEALAAFSLSEQATIGLFQGARDSVVAIATSTDIRDPFTRRTAQTTAGGSGFFWDDAGHVVTNDHVIAGATTARVHLADGRSFPARLVGRDPVHDLAVLRISGRNLPAALPLGENAGLQVGQQVLAIGNPFGLDWTLTTGIVSALDRDIPDESGRGMTGLIQTDAAINPGNSGGPLLDSRGRLIGVNTSIYSPSGASAGIGFAVPVGTVQRIVPDLIATGRYSPPTLEVVWDARINAAVNRQGLPGVMIVDVPRGSAAARAGLVPARLSDDGRILPGDVITGLAGRPVATADELLAVLDGLEPGMQVEVVLWRDGREWRVELPVVRGR